MNVDAYHHGWTRRHIFQRWPHLNENQANPKKRLFTFWGGEKKERRKDSEHDTRACKYPGNREIIDEDGHGEATDD
jgi:hypothetical protein